MRIMIKGGVWKNTEDEILKAAVMKYGMNQWARVASLLSRKSAKQCKARWYEWLDPSIKKTEWARDEEEKLLHLAKLMPAQWRTIAPIVGRTAAQCMEHYERLLDAAQTHDHVIDDPRRLRPGEIDPNPENKPARPDPVDMDEDEKEMLSEARARLANTKGKKAKRKAREKQLDEARRLAALQKRRELKAAGLTGRATNLKKRKFLDYATEIPFQKDVPAGFFNVAEERAASRNQALDPRQVALQLDKLDGQRRDDHEAKLRQQDAKRQRSLMKADLPQAIAAVNEKNDPIHAVKRQPLQLPAPVVAAHELTALAKLGLSASHAAALAADTATPLVAQRDAIMEEAANLAAMARAPTPLLGGDNVALQAGTGYAGATPLRSPWTTGSVSSSVAPPSTAMRTPLRDELGINRDGQQHELQQRQQQRSKRHKAALLSSLAQLPAPQNEYEVSVPAVDDGDVAMEGAEQEEEEDAGDREARLALLQQQQRELELRRRSQAVQRGLPRPTALSAATSSTATDLVALELRALVQHDAVHHAVATDAKAKGKSKSKSRSLLEKIPDVQLAAARSMVAVEANLAQNPWAGTDSAALAAIWLATQQRHVVETAAGTRAFAASDADALAALQREFRELRDAEAQLAKRAAKLQDRVRLLTGGLAARAQAAATQYTRSAAQLRDAEIERACFARLAEMESGALQRRMARLAGEVNTQQRVELALQRQYALAASSS